MQDRSEKPVDLGSSDSASGPELAKEMVSFMMGIGFDAQYRYCVVLPLGKRGVTRLYLPWWMLC